MALDPEVAAVMVVVVAGNPAGVGVGRCDVDSGGPDVAGSVPAMISGLPDPVGMWRGWNDLVDGRRRADADCDLGTGDRCCAEAEAKGAGCGKKWFVHQIFSLATAAFLELLFA